jgi:cytochrome c biogenesis protein
MSTKNITIIVGEAIKNGYFIFQQRKNYYCVKGLIGRIAPVFVHLSIILILFGSIIASIGGFNAQELIGKSEIFYIQNVVSSGSISKFPQQAIRVNDFWINYYKNNKIKQFYSNISLLNENGKEIINKTISVNKPLIYRNLTFYQTDWNLLGLRFSNKNNFFEIPFITNLQNGNKVWLTWLPTKQNVNNIFNGNLIIVNNYKGKIYVYDKTGRIINKIDLNDFLIENNYQLIEFLTVTGIQIKSDPGVIFIYAGFAFLMVSTLLSYLSFSQIWLIIKNYQKQKNLIIGAKTNRTKIFLNTELFKLTKNKNE